MKFVLALLMLAVSCVSAQDPNIPMTLCGRQLAMARVLLCYGPDAEVDKRGRLPHYVLDNLAEDYDDHDWPWTGRRGALAAWSRNKRQGLANECCLKPCTADVILEYC